MRNAAKWGLILSVFFFGTKLMSEDDLFNTNINTNVKTKHYVVKNEWEENFDAGNTLYLKCPGAWIRINPWNKEMIKVISTKNVNFGSRADVDISISNIKMKSSRRGKLLKLKITFPRDILPSHIPISYSVSGRVDIYLPEHSNLKIRSKSSIIDINGINGNIDVKTKVGHISYMIPSIMPQYRVHLETSIGNIKLVTGKEIKEIKAKVKKGKITSFFKIDTTQTKNANVELKTTNGNISIQKIKK